MLSLLSSATSSEQDHDNAIFGSEHISVSTPKSSVVQEEPMAVSVKVCIHKHTHTCGRTHMHTHTHAHTHTYTVTHTHTHTHTAIYSHIVGMEIFEDFFLCYYKWVSGTVQCKSLVVENFDE